MANILVNGTQRNLAWQSRSEYFSKSPIVKPNNFETHANQFIDKSAGSSSYSIQGEANLPILDQSSLGSCVFNAIAASIMITENIEKNDPVIVSRLFLYYCGRLIQNTVQVDSGSNSGTGIAALLQYGAPRESSWEYDISKFTENPNISIFLEASNNKSYSWFNINGSGSSRLDQIETAIRNNTPVIFGSPVDSTIQSYQKGQVLTIPKSNDLIGGHELVICGFNIDSSGKRTWIIRNSWGSGYGDNGHLLADDAWMGWDQCDGFDILSKADKIIY